MGAQSSFQVEQVKYVSHCSGSMTNNGAYSCFIYGFRSTMFLSFRLHFLSLSLTQWEGRDLIALEGVYAIHQVLQLFCVLYAYTGGCTKDTGKKKKSETVEDSPIA